MPTATSTGTQVLKNRDFLVAHGLNEEVKKFELLLAIPENAITSYEVHIAEEIRKRIDGVMDNCRKQKKTLKEKLIDYCKGKFQPNTFKETISGGMQFSINISGSDVTNEITFDQIQACFNQQGKIIYDKYISLFKSIIPHTANAKLTAPPVAPPTPPVQPPTPPVQPPTPPVQPPTPPVQPPTPPVQPPTPPVQPPTPPVQPPTPPVQPPTPPVQPPTPPVQPPTPLPPTRDASQEALPEGTEPDNDISSPDQYPLNFKKSFTARSVIKGVQKGWADPMELPKASRTWREYYVKLGVEEFLINHGIQHPQAFLDLCFNENGDPVNPYADSTKIEKLKSFGLIRGEINPPQPTSDTNKRINGRGLLGRSGPFDFAADPTALWINPNTGDVYWKSVKRKDSQLKAIPGGMIDYRQGKDKKRYIESPIQTALREFLEETSGITFKKMKEELIREGKAPKDKEVYDLIKTKIDAFRKKVSKSGGYIPIPPLFSNDPRATNNAAIITYPVVFELSERDFKEANIPQNEEVTEILNQPVTLELLKNQCYANHGDILVEALAVLLDRELNKSIIKQRKKFITNMRDNFVSLAPIQAIFNKYDNATSSTTPISPATQHDSLASSPALDATIINKQSVSQLPKKHELEEALNKVNHIAQLRLNEEESDMDNERKFTDPVLLSIYKDAFEKATLESNSEKSSVELTRDDNESDEDFEERKKLRKNIWIYERALEILDDFTIDGETIRDIATRIERQKAQERGIDFKTLDESKDFIHRDHEYLWVPNEGYEFVDPESRYNKAVKPVEYQESELPSTTLPEGDGLEGIYAAQKLGDQVKSIGAGGNAAHIETASLMEPPAQVSTAELATLPPSSTSLSDTYYTGAIQDAVNSTEAPAAKLGTKTQGGGTLMATSDALSAIEDDSPEKVVPPTLELPDELFPPRTPSGNESPSEPEWKFEKSFEKNCQLLEGIAKKYLLPLKKGLSHKKGVHIEIDYVVNNQAVRVDSEGFYSYGKYYDTGIKKQVKNFIPTLFTVRMTDTIAGELEGEIGSEPVKRTEVKEVTSQIKQFGVHNITSDTDEVHEPLAEDENQKINHSQVIEELDFTSSNQEEKHSKTSNDIHVKNVINELALSHYLDELDSLKESKIILDYRLVRENGEFMAYILTPLSKWIHDQTIKIPQHENDPQVEFVVDESYLTYLDSLTKSLNKQQIILENAEEFIKKFSILKPLNIDPHKTFPPIDRLILQCSLNGNEYLVTVTQHGVKIADIDNIQRQLPINFNLVPNFTDKEGFRTYIDELDIKKAA